MPFIILPEEEGRQCSRDEVMTNFPNEPAILMM